MRNWKENLGNLDIWDDTIEGGKGILCNFNESKFIVYEWNEGGSERPEGEFTTFEEALSRYEELT